MYYRLIIALLALFVIVAYIDTKNLQQHFDDAKILREYNKTSSLLGIGIKESDGKLKIKDVIMNTPAQKVGLEVGDILLDIDGKKVSSAYMIRDYLNYVKKKCDLPIITKCDTSFEAMKIEKRADEIYNIKKDDYKENFKPIIF